MKVRIIKGTNQIGGCITEISTDKTKILIDFGDNLDGSKQVEVDGLTKGPKKYDAVFITHSHGDHMGNVCNILNDIDVYMEEKSMEIHNVVCDFKRDYGKKIRLKNGNIKFMEYYKPIYINDITITPYIVDHSAYNASMFLIEAEGKKILHTGDFRINGRKGKIFEPILEEIGNIDLLITEGTTFSRNINLNKTEFELEKEIKEIVSKYKQVYFIQSSTNIDRIVTFYKAKGNKKFIQDLCMTSVALKLDNIPNSNTYKDVYTYISEVYRGIYEPYGRYSRFINKTILEIPFEEEFIMSIKSSMINDLLKHKDKIKDACFIYSVWDGYKKEEKGDKKLIKMIEEIKKIGVLEIDKHTSGHADKKAFEILKNNTNPKSTIIIHTDDKENAIKEARKIFDNVIELNDNEYYFL